MSELKAYHCNEWHNEYTEFYLKSEADKVIAELKDEASTAHRVCSRQIQQIASNEQEIRHNKHKRCLAMATFCHVSSVLCEGPDSLFYRRWFHKWYELAEKFKPNSTAQ